jgi:hypothetical protein
VAGLFDYYIGATGLSSEESKTPQTDRFTLQTYSNLAKYLTELERELIRQESQNNIAQLKADMKTRSDLMGGLTDLAEANVRDRDSIRSAAARVESSLASQLRDIQRPGYQIDGAIRGRIKDEYGKKDGALGAMSALFFTKDSVYGDGTTIANRLTGKPEKMVSTWPAIVKDSGGALQIDGEGNLIITEGRITEDSTLQARINDFHDQWKTYKATSDAQRASIEGKMEDLRDLRTKVDEDTDGELDLEAVRGNIYGIAKKAQTDLDKMYGYEGEKVAEQIQAYERNSELYQEVFDKMKSLDKSDPTTMSIDVYKRFVGNEDIQEWASDKGYEFGSVDEVTGQYFPGRDDELALRMWGMESASAGKRKWFERGSSGEVIRIYRDLSDEELESRYVEGRGYPVNERGVLLGPNFVDDTSQPEVYQWADGAGNKAYVVDGKVYIPENGKLEIAEAEGSPIGLDVLMEAGFDSGGGVIIQDVDEAIEPDRYLTLEDFEDVDLDNLKVGSIEPERRITYVETLQPEQRTELVDEGVRAPLNAYYVRRDGGGGVELRNGEYYAPQEGLRYEIVDEAPAAKFKNRPQYLKQIIRRADIKRARSAEVEAEPMSTRKVGTTVVEDYRVGRPDPLPRAPKDEPPGEVLFDLPETILDADVAQKAVDEQKRLLDAGQINQKEFDEREQDIRAGVVSEVVESLPPSPRDQVLQERYGDRVRPDGQQRSAAAPGEGSDPNLLTSGVRPMPRDVMLQIPESQKEKILAKGPDAPVVPPLPHVKDGQLASVDVNIEGIEPDAEVVKTPTNVPPMDMPSTGPIDPPPVVDAEEEEDEQEKVYKRLMGSLQKVGKQAKEDASLLIKRLRKDKENKDNDAVVAGE